MTGEYYIASNGETKGPYSKAQLQRMWDSGVITSDTQYWTEGADDWYLLATFLDDREFAGRRGLEQTVTPTVIPPTQEWSRSQPPVNVHVHSPGRVRDVEEEKAPVAAAYWLAFLIPFIGIIMGIYILTKARIGHAITVIIISIMMMDFWVSFWPSFWASFAAAAANR